MASGETFKASIIMQGNAGTAYVNDFGYVDLSGSTHIDTGTAAGAFQTLVQTAFAAALPSGITFMRYRFACVSGAHAGEIGYVEVDPPVTGAGSSPSLPSEICISMKRNTGHSSRRDRGRIFFGPVMDTYRTGGNIDFIDVTDAALTNVSALLAANLSVGGATLNPVILAANGTYSGRKVIHTSIAQVLVHRKSRRMKVGT